MSNIAKIVHISHFYWIFKYYDLIIKAKSLLYDIISKWFSLGSSFFIPDPVHWKIFDNPKTFIEICNDVGILGLLQTSEVKFVQITSTNLSQSIKLLRFHCQIVLLRQIKRPKFFSNLIQSFLQFLLTSNFLQIYNFITQMKQFLLIKMIMLNHLTYHLPNTIMKIHSNIFPLFIFGP